MSTQTKRDQAVAYVYELILSGDTEEAMTAAKAILLVDQADSTRAAL